MKSSEDNFSYAEVFDALSHPLRVKILKTIKNNPLSFAELKRRVDIESSGHLQYHLSKLSKFVKTDEYGRYILSDCGKDALFFVENVKRITEAGKGKFTFKLDKQVRVSLTLTVLFLAGISLAALVNGVYVPQTKYYCDVLKGNLIHPANFTWCTFPFTIKPGEILNFTNSVGPPTTFYDTWYYGVRTAVLLPESNETFKRFSYAVFVLTISNSSSQEKSSFTFFLTGPDGSLGEIVDYSPYIFPPYERSILQPQTYLISPDSTIGIWLIMPVETYGNYTLHVQNIGNTTIYGTVKIYSKDLTVTTIPLEKRLNNVISNPVKIYSKNEVVANPMRMEIIIPLISIVGLTALIIYWVNRKMELTVTE